MVVRVVVVLYCYYYYFYYCYCYFDHCYCYYNLPGCQNHRVRSSCGGEGLTPPVLIE